MCESVPVWKCACDACACVLFKEEVFSVAFYSPMLLLSLFILFLLLCCYLYLSLLLSFLLLHHCYCHQQLFFLFTIIVVINIIISNIVCILLIIIILVYSFFIIIFIIYVIFIIVIIIITIVIIVIVPANFQLMSLILLVYTNQLLVCANISISFIYIDWEFVHCHFVASNWNAGCGGYLDNFKILSILTLNFNCGFPCALGLEKLWKMS